MEEILNMISGVGFPIAMCVILLYYGKSALSEMRSTIDSLKDQFITLHAAVENNNKLVAALIALVNKEGDDLK